MNSLISVIVPIYNVEPYLSRCVDSILDQTYTNLEIILVNDGSPDNCGKICNEYALADPRIKVIHKENGGLSDARNVALDEMNGEYVTFIDSDDFVEPNYVEILYNLARKYNVQLSISNFLHYYEEKGAEKANPQRIENSTLSSEKAVETMFYQDKFETSAWGKLYKKELFGNDIRYPKGLLYEDLPTTYKLILRAKEIAYTNQHTYYYRIRNDSIQWAPFNQKKLDILKVADIMTYDIMNNSTTLLKPLKCRLFSSYLNIYLQTNLDNESEHILWQRISYLKYSILFNIKARKRAIIAAFICFFHKSAVRYIFKLHNHRR